MSRPAVRVRDARQELADGTVLAADVATVDDGAPRPALLIRTPYSRAAARDAYDLVGLARDGWAVVVQDVRGRFDSTGDFLPFWQEAADGAAAVAWAAAQPWCDGRVATTGVSYLGAAQWAAGGRVAPALRAMNPLLAPAEPPERWLWRGGAFSLELAQFWTLVVLASDHDPATAARAQELGARYEDLQRTSLADDPLCALSQTYRSWRTGPSPAARSWAPAPVPTFQVVGWFDVFCESGLAAHTAQVAAGIPVTTVVGPWAHEERLTSRYPELDLGGAGDGELAGVRSQGWSWMRERLAPGAQDAPSELRYYLTGAAEWRTSLDWPPPGGRECRAFLSAGQDSGVGELRGAPPAAPGWRSWRHDPLDPVPVRGGRRLGPGLPPPGPCDQRPVEERADVLVFTSAPLEDVLDIEGVVRADLHITSTAPTFDVALTLSDVHPSGASFTVVEGLTRRRRGDPSTAVIGSAAHRFQPGHRVRVALAGSAFPRCDVSPTEPAEHIVHWGSGAGSMLVLPVTRGWLPDAG